MSPFEVSAVTFPDDTPDGLLSYFIESPKLGTTGDGYVVSVEGWVVAKDAPVVAVVAYSAGQLLRRSQGTRHRPDVAKAHPGVPGAGESGFKLLVNLLNTDPLLPIVLHAVFEDGASIHFASFRCTREPLKLRFEPTIQPLLMTNLGRSGSTWMTSVLNSHPQVVAYEPFRAEPRIATYWMDVLSGLSDPESYLQTIQADVEDDYWWTGQKAPRGMQLPEHDTMREWLCRDAVESLASFCAEMIEQPYRRLAEIQERDIHYFVERSLGTGRFARRLVRELYPASREIVLVRDFRDVMVSMLAFNKRSKLPLFGRERFDSDRDFVIEQGKSVAYLAQHWLQSTASAHLVRYEDLVRRPIETAQGIFSYLGVASEPDLVERVFATSAASSPDAQRNHQTSTDQLASIGRWKTDLDPDLVKACEETFGEALNVFGYLDTAESTQAEEPTK